MCTLFLIMICVVLFLIIVVFFFFKQKTAYEMRISDWSSDVCSSDLEVRMRDGAWRDPPIVARKSRRSSSALLVSMARRYSCCTAYSSSLCKYLRDRKSVV